MRRLARILACILSIAVLPALVASTALAQTRTPWQMHNGLEVTGGNPLGLVAFSCAPAQHGDPCEYDVVTIPPGNDAGWGAAPDPDIIGFSYYPSRVCSAPSSCLAYGDFTYFQTFVDIPANVVVTTFTIDFSGMDDGCRVTIFNSTYPTGLVVPGSYVFLGGSGTTNLQAYVVSGEVNRVVVTQVDDCCIENNLRSAVVVLNGTVVNINRPPDCSTAVACQPTLWPPNHKYNDVEICGVTDPDGDAVTIEVTGVTQDEPVNTRGDGNTCPDAKIVDGHASVRAERTGTPAVPGNGRVYAVHFTATDAGGASCTGTVTVCVPHDMGEIDATCIDDGQLYNSLGSCSKPGRSAESGTADRLSVGTVTSSHAQIEFELARDTHVLLSVFDVAGRRVATVENASLGAGSYQRSWDMSGVDRGVYFARLQAGEVMLTKTILKLK